MRRGLVTGGGSGVGLSTGYLLSELGWQVLLVDIAEEPTELPANAVYAQLDVVNSEAIGVELDRFCGESGLDALVNCAAVQYTGATLDAPVEAWRRVLDVNLVAASALIREAIGHLEKSAGCVVNVASVHALATSSDIGVYAASKAALVALTRALAIELADRGVRVNAVLPGAIDTPMLRAGLARVDEPVDIALATLAERTVIGRVGAPREVAQAISFLAHHEQSSFVTGATLVVDGGATIRLSTES